jgi:hypothetical protein
MNVTLSVDDELLKEAREVARKQGTSLNDMIRSYLQTVVGVRSGDALVEELDQLWSDHPGHSGGGSFDRADAYKGRL